MTAPGLSEAPVRLRIRWPALGPGGERDNFFVGAWHPTRSLQIEFIDAGHPPTARVSGHNWMLASATEPRRGAGLVHRDDRGGMAFRGYVMPDVHSYSPATAIRRCWLDIGAGRNGVFSTALIGEGGSELVLATDLLGMGALYWRRLGDLVLFATNPRYLGRPDDRPDRFAWRYLLQTSWIAGDRSLTAEVQRVPAGCTARFAGSGSPVLSAPAWRSLPEGIRPIDSGGLAEVEGAFQQALDRCLGLRVGGIMLPLSSGFDSRRILAGLVHRKTDFKAVTCRVLQQGDRDLDARFASQMARDFGFPHMIVDASDAQYLSDDICRRALVDAESGQHSWSIRVHHALSGNCDALLDGVAGDILGDPVGWSKLVGLSVGSRAAEKEIESISEHAIRSHLDSVLAPAAWPSVEELREDLRAYLRSLQPRANLGELAFILLRQRRDTVLWSQQLAPPGVVPLYPYLDADYLGTTLSLRSEDKHATNLQRSCLREFWPDFFRYGGNRDIPADVPPGTPEREHRRTVRCAKQLLREIEAADAIPQLRDLLAPRGRLALAASRSIPGLAARWAWYLRPLMELVSRQAHRIPVWESLEAP